MVWQLKSQKESKRIVSLQAVPSFYFKLDMSWRPSLDAHTPRGRPFLSGRCLFHCILLSALPAGSCHFPLHTFKRFVSMQTRAWTVEFFSLFAVFLPLLFFLRWACGQKPWPARSKHELLLPLSPSFFAYIIYIVACSVGIYNLRDRSESAKKS